jgi:hypothetical protein
MKHILILLGLMALGLPAFAQNQNPDLSFYISFSALSNSPPNSALGGSAGYFRVKLPFLPGMPTYTNRLELGINVPAPPEDVCIWEKQEDGSFLPVTEVTNLFGDADNGYYLDQPFTLSPDQVHSLISGNWYVAVDFGSSNYIGNLAPQYAFANGPTAIADSPTAYPNTEYSYTAIALNNRTASVVFDGSHSMDPFYLPIQYFWTGWAGIYAGGDSIFTSTNVLTTNVFELGSYIIGLQASDSIADGQPHYLDLQVITAGQTVSALISNIQTTPMPKFQKQVLINVLSTAAKGFNRGNMNQGRFELEFYEQLVRASHFDSTLTFFLLQPAQQIIDAFSATGKRR